MPPKKTPKGVECFKPPYREPNHKAYKINPYMPAIPTPAPTYVPLQNDYERCRPYEGWIEAPKSENLPEARWMYPQKFLLEENYKKIELKQRKFFHDVEDLKSAKLATVDIINRCPKKMKVNHPPGVCYDYRFVGWSVQPNLPKKAFNPLTLKECIMFGNHGYRYPEPQERASIHRDPYRLYKDKLSGPPWW